MNKEILRKHIKDFITTSKKQTDELEKDSKERIELVKYYQCFNIDKIKSMSEEDFYQYISKLWAMLIWGNKQYVVDKLIEENGFNNLRKHLVQIVWGKQDIADRWNSFRKEIKGIGPAMISEILCKTHPDDFMLWNRRAYIGLNYLQVDNLPRYDYQLTGDVYKYLCNVCKEISQELSKAGFPEKTLLAVDYFIWKELQVKDNLVDIYTNQTKTKPESLEKSEFVHNDVRDKLRDIGQWLGFIAKIEQKVADGSKVDTIWEATIGNMGRVIYVFEVQTKGSYDSLILNLLKSLNNPAVQGVVAISDKKQLETIRKHASAVKDLNDKLKYWNYEEVLKVHESLEFINRSINDLGLVPETILN